MKLNTTRYTVHFTVYAIWSWSTLSPFAVVGHSGGRGGIWTERIVRKRRNKKKWECVTKKKVDYAKACFCMRTTSKYEK